MHLHEERGLEPIAQVQKNSPFSHHFSQAGFFLLLPIPLSDPKLFFPSPSLSPFPPFFQFSFPRAEMVPPPSLQPPSELSSLFSPLFGCSPPPFFRTGLLGLSSLYRALSGWLHERKGEKGLGGKAGEGRTEHAMKFFHLQGARLK